MDSAIIWSWLLSSKIISRTSREWPVADVALRDADRDLNYTIFIILTILRKEALENK